MNYNRTLLMKAYEFATNKHNGQFDKSGRDYIYHCRRVGNLDATEIAILIPRTEEEYFEKIVGLLHDVIEDTKTTYEELLTEFGKSVADHVNMLTRREDMSYMEYINSLKYNEVCRKVKKRDLLHNMDLTRLNKITKKDIERNRKYLKALEVLIDMEV